MLFLPHPSRIISGFLSYSNSSIAHISRCALNMGSHPAGHVLAYITQLEASNFTDSTVPSSYTQESRTAQKLSITTDLVKLYGSIPKGDRQGSLQKKIQQQVSVFLFTPERTCLLGSLSRLLPPPLPFPSSPISKAPSK